MGGSIGVGLIAGVILGVIEMFLFNGNWSMILMPALMGALIGFAATKVRSAGIIGIGAIVGALFFIAIAAQSGLWLDDIATGAITGGLIGIIMKFVVPKVLPQ